MGTEISSSRARDCGAGGSDCARGEALSLLSDPELSVDLLVLDIMMPGLSGLTVARRASSLRPDMGILFISGRVILPEGDPHPEVTGPLAFSENPSKLTCSSKR